MSCNLIRLRCKLPYEAPGGQTPEGQTPKGQAPRGQTPEGIAPDMPAANGLCPDHRLFDLPPALAKQIASWYRQQGWEVLEEAL